MKTEISEDPEKQILGCGEDPGFPFLQILAFHDLPEEGDPSATRPQGLPGPPPAYPQNL